MSLKSNLTLKGLVEITVRDRGGRVMKRTLVQNRIVDIGFDLMSRLLVENSFPSHSWDITPGPIKAIGLGTGKPSAGYEVDLKDEDLYIPWKRLPIETVEVIAASHDFVSSATGNPRVMTLRSKNYGSYGNRIQASVAQSTHPYNITIIDDNTGITYPSSGSIFGTIDEIADTINVDPLIPVEAIVPTTGWGGVLDLSGGSDPYLGGGGTGVIVSAQFENPDAVPVPVTEAALFTEQVDGHMFNKVRFPEINVTNGLNITFRWKLLFQEATT